MIGTLIVAGIIFYAVLYSGVENLQGRPTTVLQALMGDGLTAAGSGGTKATKGPVIGPGGSTPDRVDGHTTRG